jgi:hypothetical protein
MKALPTLLVLSLFLGFGAQSRAGENAAAGGGVFIGGGPAPTPIFGETCVEVEIGGERTQKLNCINQQLKQQAEHVQPVGNVAPLDANSPAVKVHGFSETALSQQYGKNLGKSAVPFRPAK